MKLNSVDLNKLAVFMEVARSGGITKAAVCLGLTPSAVSQSIRGLEEALETSLFDRIGKSFLLSPQGSVLFKSLGRYQDGLLESLCRIKGAKQNVKGQLRLGVFYGFSNAMIADFLAKLHQAYPDLEVDVLFGSPSEIDQLLSYKRLDFAINLFKSSADLTLTDTALIADELWLVSSQKPPQRALNLDEIRKAPFIDYYRKSHLISSWIYHHFGKRIRDLKIAMYAAHSELVVQLILKGAGIGIVASSIAKPYVDAGELYVIRGHRQQLVSQIWLKQNNLVEKDEANDVFKKYILGHFSR